MCVGVTGLWHGRTPVHDRSGKGNVIGGVGWGEETGWKVRGLKGGGEV